ncbi:MAG: hypothetical protein LZF60_340162 [Nitrospira sp.]|nr:MAG: hypothetical protein LZF60_340162 [Nitrospira sp.]
MGATLIPAATTYGGLTTPHRDDLHNSGLNLETIEASRIYSAHSGQVSELLGFKTISGGMVFPYLSVEDETYVRVKLNEAGQDGKRYRSPRGSTNRLYVPSTLPHGVLSDSTKALYITEGEKKALKARQEGLHCVALSGVWAWRMKEGDTSAPISDLDRILWEGRTVSIVFDSDAATKPEVARAEIELANELARRGATVYSVRLPQGEKKVGLDDYLVRHPVESFLALPSEQIAPRVLAIGLGSFLSKQVSVSAPLIRELLPAEANGWIAGEEKLGKTLYALEEALCLALGRSVCGKFEVPERRKVLFIEEDDSPQLVKTRIDAFLRGYGLDPDDKAVRKELDEWFFVAAWTRFSLDDPGWVVSLDRTIDRFRPRIVYIDALFKVTAQDIYSPRDTAKIVNVFDDLTRKYGCNFRIIHHFRKGQGHGRSGRGSQELNGSFVLGAWAQTSLFLEPRGKKYGEAKLSVQTKLGPPPEPFKLVIESEGPSEAPKVYRLRVESLDKESKAGVAEDTIYNLLGTLPHEPAVEDEAGISKLALVKASGFTDGTARAVLGALVNKGKAKHVGTAKQNAKLYRAV